MNFFIWEDQGFYSPGFMIYVDTSLDNIINKLYASKNYNWYYIQGIETLESKKYFKDYCFNNIKLFESELEKIRLNNLNIKNETKEFYDKNKNFSLKQLMEYNWYRLLYQDQHKKIIDNLSVNNKRSPWFIEPKIQSCDIPFITNPAN